MLLHGQKGLGKSSTAEAIAAYVARPLHRIPGGNYGDFTVVELEKELLAHFLESSKTGAILLTDEADVLVAMRRKGQVNRNALVSITLRLLEYF
jgi:SpoVK/Ycf46/Vps4 family AAA+-type ATPase